MLDGPALANAPKAAARPAPPDAARAPRAQRGLPPTPPPPGYDHGI